MSIDGLVSASVLFHDRDGTASLKVVDLSGGDSYTTGKVAIISGTAGTSSVTIQCQPTTYKGASGEAVSFTTVRRIAFSASRQTQVKDALTSQRLLESDGDVSITRFVSSGDGEQGPSLTITPGYASGTSSYSIVIYGE
jgi:hypothetical protein